MFRVIFFICFIAYILFWDLRLKTLRALSMKRARLVIDKKDTNIARMLFAFGKAYGEMNLIRELEGRKNLPETFMIITNHQSIIDIAIIFYSFPLHHPRFVAKRELARGVPMISHILQTEKHAIINRESDFSATMRELQRLAVMSREGFSPVIFPEGTRSKDGKVKPFHVGAVRKVLETTPMPVLSVALDGGYRLAKLKHFWENLRGATYRIKFLTLYPAPSGKKETVQLLQAIHDEIKTQVDSWHGEEQKEHKKSPTA